MSDGTLLLHEQLFYGFVSEAPVTPKKKKKKKIAVDQVTCIFLTNYLVFL